MKLVEYYSHLNGLEHIIVHKPHIWEEIQEVIQIIDAEACKTKVSKEKTMPGKVLYSPPAINACFKEQLLARGWKDETTRYWVTSDQDLIRRTMQMDAEQQRKEIIAAGKEPISSYNQTDFVKERVQIEVQFGKYSFIAYDLFVKHMAFFIGNVMDVGIEIMPMKGMTRQMSSGVPYYEGALYDLLRQGRNTPAVPLVLIGLTP